MMATLHCRACDEVLRDGPRREHSVQRILGDLLRAEVAEKQVRSIRCRLAAAKLPLAKELADFDFKASNGRVGTGASHGST